jgi:hypothetical protein
MGNLVERMIRAAKLDVSLYEEVEADRDALKQATIVVILSSLAAGVGTAAHAGIGGLIAGTIIALAGWYVWAFLTYWIGTRFLPEPQTSADYDCGQAGPRLHWNPESGSGLRNRVDRTTCHHCSAPHPIPGGRCGGMSEIRSREVVLSGNP